MTFDSIAERVPLRLRPVQQPRVLGLIIMALESGPATAETIIDRLRIKYRYYPDKRKIAAKCSKYKTVFEVAEIVQAGGLYGNSTHKVIKWKLRDDINVMDGEIQTE